MAKPDRRWGLFLVKMILLAVAVYCFAIPVAILVVVLLILVWLIFKGLNLTFPHALVSGVATQTISFLLTRKVLGAPATVPVRDLRLRDSSGKEFLVRLKGQLQSGSVAVGDEIIAKGWMRQGMLRFSGGFNKRINATITVKVE